MDTEENVVAGIFVMAFLSVVLLIGGAIYEGVAQTSLERKCLAAGYARADWRWIGPSYCITRTDQTDVVVPFDSIAGK